jgi:hypothetical protein
MTLVVDGGPGVAIKTWISNGTDFLTMEYMAAYNDFRLFPTQLKHKYDNDPLTYFKYHMVALGDDGKPVEGDPWSEFNEYWFQLDSWDYANLATDAFVVGFDANGIVQSVASQAVRSTYHRA